MAPMGRDGVHWRMAKSNIEMPGLWRGLSARLIVLTVTFVMLAEILIFVPSVSRYRLNYLQQHLDAAYQASLVVQAAPNGVVSTDLAYELLDYVGVNSIALKMEHASYLMLGRPPTVVTSYDLDSASIFQLIVDALEAMAAPEDGPIRVHGTPSRVDGVTVQVTLDPDALHQAVLEFGTRILILSILISFITAGLVFLALQRLMVRPIQRMTEDLIAFREAPEDVTRGIEVSNRHDEIGIAQRELAEMERGLRAALRQRARLAAVGSAVSKISHDLRNILATAALVSDRLGSSEDPQVRRQAPLVLDAIDRAVKLCQDTLRFARADEPDLDIQRFELAPLVDEVMASLGTTPEQAITCHNEIDASVVVQADRDQLFRVIMNLTRNAVDAMARQGGDLTISASRGDTATSIDVADSGPGIPDRIRSRLFEAFSGGAGGTGLGLAIARELMRAHGGDLVLLATGPTGSTFRMTLPSRDAGRRISDKSTREARDGSDDQDLRQSA